MQIYIILRIGYAFEHLDLLSIGIGTKNPECNIRMSRKHNLIIRFASATRVLNKYFIVGSLYRHHGSIASCII